MPIKIMKISVATIKQIVHFGIVGIAATISDLTMYKTLVDSEVSTPYAKSLSFIVGLTISYLGNSKITFKVKSRRLKKFLFIYIVALVINVSVNEACLNFVLSTSQHSLLLSWCLATACSALFNFLLLKKWVFA
jgi:putative flippase GtrA